MEIMPFPTCCKLHAHNYTCIPIFFRVAGDPGPYWSACIITFYFYILLLHFIFYHLFLSVVKDDSPDLDEGSHLFPTMGEVFDKVHPAVGFNIEVKYPMKLFVSTVL